MESEQRLCPERACSSGNWAVRETAPSLWWVEHEHDGSTWVVAGTDPACPRCGTTLVTLLELEGGFGSGDWLEIGPLFDFARTL